jgi:hypothetical protein
MVISNVDGTARDESVNQNPTDLGERFAQMAANSERVGQACISLPFLRLRGAVGLCRWLRIILTHGLRRAHSSSVCAIPGRDTAV